MKSSPKQKVDPQLLRLQRLNQQLRNNAWSNYVKFLETLLVTTHHPMASELLPLIKGEQYTELVMVADRYSSSEFGTAAEHRLCNQLSAVIRKYPYPKGSVAFNPKEKAFKTFLKCEHKCKRVNQRFRCYLKLRSPHENVLSRARSWISYVLGDLNLSEVWGNCGFSDGANMGVHGNATSNARKILAKTWTCTPGAYHYGLAALKTDMHIFEGLTRREDSQFFPVCLEAFNQAFRNKVELVDHNKLSFVTKTAITDRTIAVEPLVNGYLQKGVDEVMRKRLRRVGINLQDQTLNQRMAREGSLPSVSDPYVTIDLSSASDSVSTELCRYLLPPDWFDFMNSIRSHAVLIEGVVTPYEKFATMGNGFCFPLETLIFASLAVAVASESHRKPDFSVYGDDIIVRQSIAPRVLEVLKICGFTANTSKTFISGPFRESCGADWYNGEDVRPVTLKYAFDSLESIFKFCNIARSKDHASMILNESLEFLESLVPPELFFVRPYKGNVDTAFEVPFDVFMSSPFTRYNREFHCWSWKELMVTACPDFEVQALAGYNVALTRGALLGAISEAPFALRYSTRTKIRRVTYGGSQNVYDPKDVFVPGIGSIKTTRRIQAPRSSEPARG